MQNSVSEFEDSYSEFGVYSSSGKLLQGSGRFKEVWEYAELAKQLDIKRSALYAEIRDSELLLGCSLLVKILKGREERAVFMEYFPKEAVTRDRGWINRFYTDAKNQIEGLQSIRYQVIGLWKEEDIFAISPLENAGSPPAYLESLERKVLSGKKVSVWTSDLSSGLFLLAGLIFRLKSILYPCFSLALSLYPLKTDISAGPGEIDPDFTFEEGELRAYQVHNKRANLEVEEIIGQVQEEGLKEYKNVFNYNHSNSGHLPDRDLSETQEMLPKKNKTWKKKRIAGYACCFFLFLIAGLLILSKAGLEPALPSLNVSRNEDMDFPSFLVHLENRGEKTFQMQNLKGENTSEAQLLVSGSSGGGSSNLSSVNLDSGAENLFLESQDLIKETNNSSKVGNVGTSNGTAENESAGNGILENQSLENGIPENESTANGTLENKS